MSSRERHVYCVSTFWEMLLKGNTQQGHIKGIQALGMAFNADLFSSPHNLVPERLFKLVPGMIDMTRVSL